MTTIKTEYSMHGGGGAGGGGGGINTVSLVTIAFLKNIF